MNIQLQQECDRLSQLAEKHHNERTQAELELRRISHLSQVSTNNTEFVLLKNAKLELEQTLYHQSNTLSEMKSKCEQLTRALELSERSSLSDPSEHSHSNSTLSVSNGSTNQIHSNLNADIEKSQKDTEGHAKISSS